MGWQISRFPLGVDFMADIATASALGFRIGERTENAVSEAYAQGVRKRLRERA
jgi:hypothetical protein